MILTKIYVVEVFVLFQAGVYYKTLLLVKILRRDAAEYLELETYYGMFNNFIGYIPPLKLLLKLLNNLTLYLFRHSYLIYLILYLIFLFLLKY